MGVGASQFRDTLVLGRPTTNLLRLISINDAPRSIGESASMNLRVSQIRGVLAVLLFGLVLVFGLSAVMAATPSCQGPVAVHQIDDAETHDVGASVCGDHACSPGPAECCPGVIGGHCGSAALGRPGEPLFPPIALEHPDWRAEAANAISGLDAEAGRRPPRFAA